MIWSRHSRLRPLAGAVYFGLSIIATSSAAAGTPTNTAAGTVESAGGEVFGSAIALLRESGYWWDQPPAEIGPARIHASGQSVRGVVRSVAGRAVRVNHRELSGHVTSAHVRSVTGAAEIDITPIFEEEGFILGLLAGDL